MQRLRDSECLSSPLADLIQGVDKPVRRTDAKDGVDMHRFPAAMTSALLCTSSPAEAQDHRLTLETPPFRDSIDHAHGVAPTLFAGFEAAFRLSRVERTLASRSDDAFEAPTFEEIARLGLILRLVRSNHFDVARGSGV